ncbi:MAG: exodeoxyribonuclease III [Victivallaceae bacterium]|nr:exodeoxyribonuclease III [Victivallaceae bacterium]
MILISWNVNGIRAVERKGFVKWAEHSGADILCLQETKAHPEQLPETITKLDGYESYWSSGDRKGYSGVAIYTAVPPLKTESGFNGERRFDNEGRILIGHFSDFVLLNIYFPNGQRDDGRLRYKLDFYDAALDFCENLRRQGKALIICGDYNTAHNEIDLARPKENENVSGFLRIERDWMDKFERCGYVDTFRKLHPDTGDAYSWWSYRTAARSRNVGWRLDYFYITPELLPEVRRAEILSDIPGSDHCPVLLELGN